MTATSPTAWTRRSGAGQVSDGTSSRVPVQLGGHTLADLEPAARDSLRRAGRPGRSSARPPRTPPAPRGLLTMPLRTRLRPERVPVATIHLLPRVRE